MQRPPACLTILYAAGKYPGASSTIPPTPFRPKKEHITKSLYIGIPYNREDAKMSFDIGIPVWLLK
jgi:hypothetical protein